MDPYFCTAVLDLGFETLLSLSLEAYWACPPGVSGDAPNSVLREPDTPEEMVLKALTG
jgi:hypothetical protein